MQCSCVIAGSNPSAETELREQDRLVHLDGCIEGLDRQIEQIALLAAGTVRKRLRYKDLVT